jgi:hypothetical protein
MRAPPEVEREPTMDIGRGVRVILVFVLGCVLLGVSLWAIPTAYVESAGVVTSAVVTDRREYIDLPGGDSWRHAFEVTFRYQPRDAELPRTASHPVSAALFDRLHVGDTVAVRYSAWGPLRHVRGVGTVLAESSPWSRLPLGPETLRETAELTLVGVAILLGLVAYERRSRWLEVVAWLVGATVVAGVLSFGWLVYALLFGVWRRRPGQGFGWMLLAVVALSTGLLYWRVPRPSPPPAGPRRTAVATVRRVESSREIWSSGERDDGESLSEHVRQPFQSVDLEFTPVGAREPVHAFDRVDSGSVAGLRDGAAVLVVYTAAEPRAAQIAGGTRAYARAALVYLLEITYALGAAAVLFYLLLAGLERLARPLVHASRALGSEPELRRRVAALPHDHAARRTLEELLRHRER